MFNYIYIQLKYMAQPNNIRNGLIQLVAYGIQNQVFNINKNQSLYVLDYIEIEMGMEMINCSELDIQTSKYKYEYFSVIDRFADQYKIQGIIIDLDEEVEYSRPILDELHKLTLEIYSYEQENNIKIDNKLNFIGSIPLVLGKITNNENSILVKLPNIFFSSESKYFSNFISYKFKIKSHIQFKKISILNVLRYDDTTYRKKISMLSSIFYELDYQYVILNNSIIPTITENNILQNNVLQYKIIYEKKIIGYSKPNNNYQENLIKSSKEKSNGIYFVIPEGLIEFISQIKFKLNFEKIIINNELETMYKIEDKGYVNLYLIKFDKPINLEPINSIIIEFEHDNNKDTSDEIIKLIDDICVYPIILNKLICINYNLGLKYLNGVINEQFDEQKKTIINKYSGNIDLLAETIVCKIDDKYKNKLDCEKFIWEYIG